MKQCDLGEYGRNRVKTHNLCRGSHRNSHVATIKGIFREFGFFLQPQRLSALSSAIWQLLPSMRLDLIYFSLSQTIVVFPIINIIHKRYSYIFIYPFFVHFFLLNICVPPVWPVIKHITVCVSE